MTEKTKKVGRKRVGIIPTVNHDGSNNPEGNSHTYRLLLLSLTSDHKRLLQALKDEQSIYAFKSAFVATLKEFSTSDPEILINATKQLDELCQQYLSEYGWKRLQANARDRKYRNGAAVIEKDGEIRNRESKKSIKLDESVAIKINDFAQQQTKGGHKLSISNAVKLLLEFWYEKHEKTL